MAIAESEIGLVVPLKMLGVVVVNLSAGLGDDHCCRLGSAAFWTIVFVWSSPTRWPELGGLIAVPGIGGPYVSQDRQGYAAVINNLKISVS